MSRADQENSQLFIKYMKDWGYYYSELSGCYRISVGDDRELEGRGVLINGGDWVVYDRRNFSGTYGVSHEDASICKVTLKNPQKYGIDYSVIPRERKVDAKTLLQRFTWFSDLFCRLVPLFITAPPYVGQRRRYYQRLQ